MGRTRILPKKGDRIRATGETGFGEAWELTGTVEQALASQFVLVSDDGNTKRLVHYNGVWGFVGGQTDA